MRYLFVLLILVACTIPLEEGNGSAIALPNENGLRPEIPRSQPPADTPGRENTTGQGAQERPIFLEGPLHKDLLLEIPLNDTIGEHHPVLTSASYPLLRHPAVLLDASEGVGYREEYVFGHGPNTSGYVIWGQDEEDRIGTFLLFEEDLPIFEYRVILERGTWQDLQGREIQLLGHTYLIAEATNTSVVFFGLDVESNLLFEDRDALVVNGTKRASTDVRVLENLLAYRLHADVLDGDLLLAPGERLSQYVPRQSLMSAFFDLQYDGVLSTASTRILIDQKSNGFSLTLDSPQGPVEIPLLAEEAGEVFLGRIGHPLHLSRCTGAQYCISPGDLVLLASSNGEFALAEYSDSSNETRELIFRSGRDRYSYEFVGDPGRNARAEILLNGGRWLASVGPYDNATDSHNLSIQMQQARELFLPGRVRLEIGNLANGTLPLTIIVPRRLDLPEERIRANLTLPEGSVVVEGAEFVREHNGEDTFAVTPGGVSIALERESGPLNVGEEAEMLIPIEPPLGVVRILG